MPTKKCKECKKNIGQSLHIKLKEPEKYCKICESDIYNDYIFCDENCLKEYLKNLNEVKSNLTKSFYIRCQECEKDISKELHYEIYIPDEKKLECNHSEYSEHRFCCKDCLLKYIEKQPIVTSRNLTAID